VRPADLLEPGLEKAREEIGDLAESEEDVVSYALFPQVAREFLQLRRDGKVPPIEEPRIFPAAAPAEAKAEAPKAGVAPIRRPPRVPPSYSLWKLSQRVQRG